VVATTWRTDEAAAPRDVDAGRRDCMALRDAGGLPHVALADLRHRGNATYAYNERHRFPHVHDAVCAAVRATGANAFYNEPPRQLGRDEYEVTTHAVLVYAGAAPPPPGPLAPGRRACMAVRVEPGSNAEVAGLRVGDVFETIDGVAPDAADPCPAVLRQLQRVAPGATARLDASAGGTTRALTLARPPAGLYGYAAIAVPRVP